MDQTVTFTTTLNALTPTKVTFKWIDVEQQVFDKIKQICVRDTLLIYQYFNEYFYIHTYASNCQFGAVIIHNDKPIALYSRKITPAQFCYTVTGK